MLGDDRDRLCLSRALSPRRSVGAGVWNRAGGEPPGLEQAGCWGDSLPIAAAAEEEAVSRWQREGRGQVGPSRLVPRPPSRGLPQPFVSPDG